MDAVLVDSNVVLDLLTEDEEWLDWSAFALERAGELGRLVINPIIYAEVSARFDRIEDVNAALRGDYFERRSLPWDAAFLAAKCYTRYRRRGGTKTSPLPDFYIGAHAAVEGLTLLTRDAKRYRTYFPRVSIIAP